MLDGGRFDVPPVRTIACPRVESTDKVRAPRIVRCIERHDDEFESE